MNVYAIKASGRYGGGMAVVAATSESEAKLLAEAGEKSCWVVRYGTPDSIDLLPCSCDGEPRVLASFETGE